MLARSVNQSRNDTASQDDSQGNTMAVGIEHSPVDGCRNKNNNP